MDEQETTGFSPLETEEMVPEAPTVFELINWGGRPEDYFLNRSEEGAKSAYQIVSAEVQNYVVSVTDALEANIKRLSDNNEDLSKELADAVTNFEESCNANRILSREIAELEMQLTDEKHRTDAAARQLGEANEEIERLKSQLHDLQVEKAVGAKQAVKVVDTKSLREQYEEAKRLEIEQSRKEAEEREAAKPAIYNIRNADMRGSILIATLAETDEDIEFPYLQRGKYREVSRADAEIFRADYLERQAEEERNYANRPQPSDLEEVVPTAPRVEEEGTTDGLDQGSSSLVGSFITEERITSIEERLTRQEHALRAAGILN